MVADKGGERDDGWGNVLLKMVAEVISLSFNFRDKECNCNLCSLILLIVEEMLEIVKSDTN